MGLKNKIASYFKENIIWILISVLIFIFSSVLGFLISFFFPQAIIYLLDFLEQAFGEELEAFSKNDNLRTFWLIFINNLSSSLRLSFGGVFFGFFTFLGLVVNGLIIGLFMGALLISGQFKLLAVGILPHAFIELSAVLLVSAWGFRLGIEWWLPKNRGKRKEVFFKNLKGLTLFLPVVMVLLIIASLIEVFISGGLVKGF